MRYRRGPDATPINNKNLLWLAALGFVAFVASFALTWMGTNLRPAPGDMVWIPCGVFTMSTNSDQG